MSDRFITEKVITDKALNVGKGNEITADISDLMGQGFGIAEILIEIAISLVIGTGTGAISEGELAFVPNINFATDIDKDSHQAAGRGLYRVAHLERSRAPIKDAIAAATATYRTQFPLLFFDDNSLNPYESILDTARYKAAKLNVTLGALTDLLTSVGTAAVTASLNLSVTRTKDRLEEYQKPVVYPFFNQLPSVDHTALVQALSRQSDLRMRKLYFMTCTSPAAGVPFSGTPADDSITNVTIEHGQGYEFKDVRRQDLAEDNYRSFHLRDTRPTGFYCLDFMKDGDLENAFLTDPDLVTKLNHKWTVDVATAAKVYSIMSYAQALKPIRR